MNKLKTKMYNGLSSDDIKKALNNDVCIFTYKELQTINNIDELFTCSNNIVILYNTSDYYGHWVCLFKKDGIINFFDSYGYFPDDEFEFIPKNYLNKNYNKIPKIVKLLYESPYKIRYNEFKLQDDETHTCGRWCIVRLLLNDLDEYEFNNLFKNIDNNDLYVTFLTKNI